MKERKNKAVWNDTQKRWCIRVQRNGIRKAFYSTVAGTRGQIEAERKADAWLNADGSTVRMKYADLFALYLESLQTRQKRVGHGSAQYIKMESIGRIWVIPCIGSKRIDSISNADYQRVIDSAFDAGKSRKTLAHISSSFTGVYKFARKNRIRIERPEFVEIYETAPSYPRTAMTSEDVRKLFTIDTFVWRGNTVPCSHIHAFRLMCLLGLRRGECAALKWSDIDGNILHVQRSVNNLHETTSGKTKTANRLIYLFPYALCELQTQRTDQIKRGLITPYVFANPHNGEPDYIGIYHQWEQYCRSNGIDGITLHELRHTTVTLSMGKISLDLLKPVIGHTSSMDTFGVYGHESYDGIKTVGDELQEIFRNIIES